MLTDAGVSETDLRIESDLLLFADLRIEAELRSDAIVLRNGADLRNGVRNDARAGPPAIILSIGQSTVLPFDTLVSLRDGVAGRPAAKLQCIASCAMTDVAVIGVGTDMSSFAY